MNPDKAIVVFDGVCLLCNGWVQFLLKRDHAARFLFVPMQTATGKRLMETHGLDPNSPLSFLLVEDDVPYTESVAILRVLRQLDPFWRVAAAILGCIPRALRDPAYRFVARHRYRLFGRRSECMVPTPEIAPRFLR